MSFLLHRVEIKSQERRLHRHLFDREKENVMTIPVAYDRPLNKQIVNVQMIIVIRKLITLVRIE